MPEAEVYAGSRGRILVIDDDRATRYVFRRILSRAGYDVQEAETGADGLEKTMQNPDLIIVDVNLPDMLGYDVSRRIKSNPQSASIPVLQISASFVSDESKVQALKGGADSYLAQPVEPTVLVAQVQALLRMRQAEALSQISARQWQTTFDALSDGLALADEDGVLVRVNRAFLRMLRLVHSDAEGKLLAAVFEAKFGLSLAGFLEKKSLEGSAELPCGSHWFRIRYDLIKSDAIRQGGSILLITDITDHKKLQETLKMSERLAATGRLAHTIAHEINNPLEALSNLLYVTQQNISLDLATRGYMEQASLQLDRISQITKQILAYHRDSKQPVPIRAEDLLDGVLTMFRARSMSSRVNIIKRFECSRLVLVHPGEMRQAFGNLVANALDAMAPAGGRLIVHCFNANDQRRNIKGIRIVFSDTGSGIPDSAYKHIFDAFYTTKDLKGSGIGLWLASEAVAKHHGYIRVKSRTEGRHRGTLFDVFLPEYVGE